MPGPLSPHWKVFLKVLGGCSLVAAPFAFFVPAARSLVLLFLYSIPSNSLVPLPHEPAIVLAGMVYEPALVALVAATGTLVSSFLDYQAVNLIFGRTRVGAARDHRLYQGCVFYFLKAPFASLVTAALVPFVALYPFRILSPTSGYPLRRYAAAVFIGRFPRFYLEALLGHALSWTNIAIVGGMIQLFCWAVLARVGRHLEHRGQAMGRTDL